MYIITKENKAIFGDEKFSREYRDFFSKASETKEETEARFNRLKEKCNKKFRVLDSDGEVYFWGEATTNNDGRAFHPLENEGIEYGCIEIQYYNEEDEIWETL